MVPKLEKAFDLRGYFDKENSITTGVVKGGPQRFVTPIPKGTIEGSGVKAHLLPGSGDWLLLDTNRGVAHLDVRLSARTDNGHSLHIHYTGLVKLDEKANKVLQYEPDAKTTEYGDHYWFVAPNIESSDESLKWVEDSFFVAQGRFIVDEQGSGIEYGIYRLVN